MADPDRNPSTQQQPSYSKPEKHIPRKDRRAADRSKNKIKNKYR